MNFVPFFSPIMGSSTSTKRKSQTLETNDGIPDSAKQTSEASQTLGNNYSVRATAPGKENPGCKRRLNFEDAALDVVKYDEDLHEEEEEEAPQIEEILFSDFFDLSPEIRKTRSGLVYHAAYAGGAVVMGGLLAGPFGAMLGGIFGSMIGWKNADNYSSMIGAMRNMSDEEKVQIFDKFQKVLNSNSRMAVQSYAYKRIQENMVVRVAKTVTQPVRHPIDTLNTVTSPIRHPIDTLNTLTSPIRHHFQTASVVASPLLHPIETTSSIIGFFNPFSSSKTPVKSHRSRSD